MSKKHFIYDAYLGNLDKLTQKHSCNATKEIALAALLQTLLQPQEQTPDIASTVLLGSLKYNATSDKLDLLFLEALLKEHDVLTTGTALGDYLKELGDLSQLGDEAIMRAIYAELTNEAFIQSIKEKVKVSKQPDKTVAPPPETPDFDIDEWLDGLGLNEETEEEPKKEEQEEEKTAVKTPVATTSKVTKEEKVSPLLALVKKTKDIRQYLLDTVYGQDAIVQSVVDGYFKAQISTPDSNKPLLTFLFAGPSGVGKTYLAKQLAHVLDMPHKRFDMSSYGNQDGKNSLMGIHKSYKDSHSGELTKFVLDNPKGCVILFDELEKATNEIIQIFLQILDAGTLEDLYLETNVSFRNAIIIMTTNVGKQLYENNPSANLASTPRSSILQALRTEKRPGTDTPYFPEAICTRFASGNVALFNHLEPHNLIKIIDKELKNSCADFKSKMGISINYDKRLPALLLFAEGGQVDARTVAGQTEIFFSREVFELSRLYDTPEKEEQLSKLKRINISINDKDKSSYLVHEMTAAKREFNVVVLCDELLGNLCTSDYKNIKLHFVTTYKAAWELIKQKEISLLCVDVTYKAKKNTAHYANAEDIDSEGTALLNALEETNSSLPVYILETGEQTLPNEVMLSFTAKGARGKLQLKDNDADFVRGLTECSFHLSLQHYAKQLSLKNSCLTFTSAQIFNKSRGCADIILGNFKQERNAELDSKVNLINKRNKPSTRFTSVFGATEAKRELKEIKDNLEDIRTALLNGKKIPKGVLLYGPSGTGKTLLAKAMSGETDVAYISANASDFLGSGSADSVEKVKSVFGKARKYAPTILFIDEIDLIARNRQMSSEYLSSVLNAFLTEMDGFSADPTKPVVVLAATNVNIDANILDPAILRRFERRIAVELPNKEERKEYVNYRLKLLNNVTMSKKEVDSAANSLVGCSFAEIDSILNHIVMTASRLEVKVDKKLFTTATESFLYGESKEISAQQLKDTAIHEAGHALILHLAGQTPSYISVVSRRGFLGYVAQEVNEEAYNYSNNDLLVKIRSALAGRAAEELYCDAAKAYNTGASSDLKMATNYAFAYISVYGMSKKFGMLSIDINNPSTAALMPEIAQEAKILVEEQYEQAKELLQQHQQLLFKLVDALCLSKSLDKEDILALLK